MRAPALRVERSKGEEVRQKLLAGGWLDPELRPVREGTHVTFPVKGLPSPLPESLLVEGVRFVQAVEFEPAGTRRPADYRALVDLPEPLRPSLPSSFDVVGDIVLVRLPDELLPYRRKVGEALLAFVPGCRKVGLDRGVEGVERIRSLEDLAGSGNWATVHRENGLSFRVDLERAYFSPRLAREHDRVAQMVRPGERLLDLFCGVGPFALSALRWVPTARAVAVDLNPEAIRLLEENARALGVSDRIEVIEADASEFLRREGLYSRVVMNLPREGYKYAISVAPHVMRSGSLHHYEVVRRPEVEARARSLRSEVTSAVPGDPWTLDPPHVVHAFSPSSDLIAWTLHRRA